MNLFKSLQRLMFSNWNCVSFLGTLLFSTAFWYSWFNCFKFVFIFLYNWAHEYVWSLGSNRVGEVYLHPWSVLPKHYSILLLHPGVGRLNVKNFPVQQPENRGNLKTTGKQNYRILYLQTELQNICKQNYRILYLYFLSLNFSNSLKSTTLSVELGA